MFLVKKHQVILTLRLSWLGLKLAPPPTLCCSVEPHEPCHDDRMFVRGGGNSVWQMGEYVFLRHFPNVTKNTPPSAKHYFPPSPFYMKCNLWNRIDLDSTFALGLSNGNRTEWTEREIWIAIPKTQKQARPRTHVTTTSNVIGWFKLQLWMWLAY